MRYYDLDNGKVRGSYAVPQPGKILHLIEDAPDDESKRDGTPGTAWIPDTDIVNVRLAEEARLAAKTQAMIDNLPSWAAIEAAINNADTLAKFRAILLKLARALYWDIKNQAN